jgi:hypothetical protein
MHAIAKRGDQSRVAQRSDRQSCFGFKGGHSRNRLSDASCEKVTAGGFNVTRPAYPLNAVFADAIKRALFSAVRTTTLILDIRSAIGNQAGGLVDRLVE